MQLSKILTPERTLCNLPGISKKRFLATVSEHIANCNPDLSADDIYAALLAREQLGSTGVGNGIAIPHCRVKTCQGIIGTLVKLDESIDFDAIDARDVDLLFVLIVPAEETDEHLNVLSKLAQLFHQDAFCHALRSATTDQQLYDAAIRFSGQADS